MMYSALTNPNPFWLAGNSGSRVFTKYFVSKNTFCPARSRKSICETARSTASDINNCSLAVRLFVEPHPPPLANANEATATQAIVQAFLGGHPNALTDRRFVPLDGARVAVAEEDAVAERDAVAPRTRTKSRGAIEAPVVANTGNVGSPATQATSWLG
jgi:hypothetical protein